MANQLSVNNLIHISQCKMEQFTSMISYDPSEASSIHPDDNSESSENQDLRYIHQCPPVSNDPINEHRILQQNNYQCHRNRDKAHSLHSIFTNTHQIKRGIVLKQQTKQQPIQLLPQIQNPNLAIEDNQNQDILPLSVSYAKESIPRKVAYLVHSLIQQLKELCLTVSLTNQVKDTLESFQFNNNQFYLENSNKKIREYLQNFFNVYIRLFSIAIRKISKYNCDKKLKYLVQTIAKQIFTQILRLAYQIRVEFTGLGKNWERKSIGMLTQQLRIIFARKGRLYEGFKRIQNFCKEANRADHIFVMRFEQKVQKLDRLHLNMLKKTKSTYLYRWRVTNLRTSVQQKEDVLLFGKELTMQIGDCFSLCSQFKFQSEQNWKSIYTQKVNQLLSHLEERYMRESMVFQGKNQTQLVFFINQNPDSIVPAQSNSDQRPNVLETYRQQFESNSHMSSVAQSYGSYKKTERNQVYCKEESIISDNECPQEIIKRCIETGQIQCFKNYEFDEKPGLTLAEAYENTKLVNFMLVPVGAVGAIRIQWSEALNMGLFQILLRIIEGNLQILTTGFDLGRKIDYLQREQNQGNWQREVFNQFMGNAINNYQQIEQNCINKRPQQTLVDQLGQSLYNAQKQKKPCKKLLTYSTRLNTKEAGTNQSFTGHNNLTIEQCQLNQKNFGGQYTEEYSRIHEQESYLEDDSADKPKARQYAAQKSSSQRKLQYWLEVFNLSSLALYHVQNGACSAPCISISDLLPFSAQIICSLLDQMSKKQATFLTRNSTNIHIFRIEGGFCKFTIRTPAKSQSNQIQNIKQCLIPLIYKLSSKNDMGRPQCQLCQKSFNGFVRQNVEQQQSQSVQNQFPEQFKLPSEMLLEILTSKTIFQLEKAVQKNLIQLFPQKKLFVKIIYNLNSQNETYWMINGNTMGSKEVQPDNCKLVQLPKLPLAPTDNAIDQVNPYYSYISAILKENSLFDNPSLKFYQAQHRQAFKISYSSNKKTTLLLGYYQNKKQKPKINQQNQLRSILTQITNCIWANNTALFEGDIVQYVNHQNLNQYNKQKIEKLYQISKIGGKACPNLQVQWQSRVIDFIRNQITPVLGFEHSKQEIKIYKFECLKQNKQALIELLSQPFWSHYRAINNLYLYQVKSNQQKNKMKKITGYVPHFGCDVEISSSENEGIWNNFIEFVKRKYKLNGQMVHQNYSKIAQILNLNDCNQKTGYIFFPVPSQKLFIIVPLQLKSMYQLTPQVFEVVVSNVVEFCQKSIQSAQQARFILLKQSICNGLFKLHQQKQTNLRKHAIEKFKHLLRIKSESFQLLLMALISLENRLQIVQKKQLFSNYKAIILSQSQSNKAKVARFIETILKTYKKQFFSITKNLMKRKRGSIKVRQLIQSLLLKKLMNGFHNIDIFARTKHERVSTLRRQSCYIFLELLSRKTRQNQRLLWKRYLQRQRDIKQIITIMKEEYELSSTFQSLKHFLQFAQERLACGISHVSQNTCSLTLGVTQNNRLFLGKQQKMIDLLQETNRQDWSFVHIAQKEIQNHFIVFKLRHINSEVKLKQQRQWLLDLVESALIPSYLQYLRSLKTKLRTLELSFPSPSKAAFNSVRNFVHLGQLLSHKNTREEVVKKQHEHHALQKEYQAAVFQGQDSNHRTSKHKVKELRQKLSQLEEKENQSTINYHIKRKTNAAYRMLYHLQRSQLSEKTPEITSISEARLAIPKDLRQKSPLKSVELIYFQRCNQTKKDKIAIKSKAATLIKTRIKKLTEKVNRRQVKQAFIGLWKCQKMKSLYNSERMLDLLR